MKRVTTGHVQGSDDTGAEPTTDSHTPLRAEDFQPDWFPDVDELSGDLYPEMTPAEPAPAVAATDAQEGGGQREPDVTTPPNASRQQAAEETWQPPQWQYSSKRARINQRQQQITP